MQSAGEQLLNWIERKGFQTQVEAAKELGLSPAMLSLMVNNRRSPGRSTALEIEERTGIPVRAWESIAIDESPIQNRHKSGKRKNHKA